MNAQQIMSSASMVFSVNDIIEIEKKKVSSAILTTHLELQIIVICVLIQATYHDLLFVTRNLFTLKSLSKVLLTVLPGEINLNVLRVFKDGGLANTLQASGFCFSCVSPVCICTHMVYRIHIHSHICCHPTPLPEDICATNIHWHDPREVRLPSSKLKPY